MQYTVSTNGCKAHKRAKSDFAKQNVRPPLLAEERFNGGWLSQRKF